MYIVYLIKPGMKLELSKCETLAEATIHAEAYKKKNPYAYYVIKDVRFGYEFEV